MCPLHHGAPLLNQVTYVYSVPIALGVHIFRQLFNNVFLRKNIMQGISPWRGFNVFSQLATSTGKTLSMCRTEGRTLNPGTIRDQVRPQSGITYLTRFNNIQVGKIDRILIGYSLNDNLNRNLPNMGITVHPRQETRNGDNRHNRVGELNTGDTTESTG